MVSVIMIPMEIQRLIRDFDSYLAGKRLSFHGIAIGATALNLLGVVTRYTRDCDILDPVIPGEILEAAKAFAVEMRASGNHIREDWFNNGPISLKRQLPPNWMQRLVPLYKGKALTLETLGRSDLLKSKLFAYCDRTTDKDDCIALKPTQQELQDALGWVQYQDANVDWPKHVQNKFEELAKELGYVL